MRLFAVATTCVQECSGDSPDRRLRANYRLSERARAQYSAYTRERSVLISYLEGMGNVR